MLRSQLPAALTVALLLALATGCAPTTPYRRGALVAAPTGEAFTEPVRGVAQARVGTTYTDGATAAVPLVGDPAMWRLEWQLDGSLRFAAGDFVALGLHGGFGRAAWAQQSAAQTPPVVEETAWTVGPNLAVGGAVDRRDQVHLGAVLALSFAGMPWSSWERLSGDPSVFEPGYDFDESAHRLVDHGTDVLFLSRLSLLARYEPHPVVALHGGLSVQNHARNIGFDTVDREGSTLSADDWGVVPFVGLALRPERRVFFQAQYFYPAAFEQLRNALERTFGGFVLGLGGDLGERSRLKPR